MVSTFKHIVTFVTLVCFLSATNGLSLVEHYCSVKGKNYWLLFAQNPTCDDVHSCSPTCCSHEHSSDCCENIPHLKQLDTDFVSSKYNLKIGICPVLDFSNLSNSLFNNLSNLSNVGSAVCLKSGFLESNIRLSKTILIKQTTEFLL